MRRQDGITLRCVPSAIDDDAWRTYAIALGQRLQKLRIDADLTQEVLAHRAGLTKSYYQQVERGRWGTGKPANPSIRVLASLARELGVELSAVTPPVAPL